MDIKDYIILSDTTKTELANSVYRFTIPRNYYSNDRSSVCSVELQAVFINENASHEVNYISTNLGSRNQYYNNTGSVLGVLTNTKANEPAYTTTENMKLVTEARPQVIEISFHRETDAKIEPVDFKLVLCFSYYNDDASVRTFNRQLYSEL